MRVATGVYGAGAPGERTYTGNIMTLTRFRALTVIGVLFVISLVLATMAILKDRQAYGAAPAAQIDDDRAGPGAHDRLLHQVLGAPSGHEHPLVHLNTQSAELHPAEDVLEG